MGGRSLLLWVAAAGGGLVVLIAGRAVFSDLRAIAATAPRVPAGGVETRSRAMLAGVFHGVSWSAGVSWLELGLRHMRPELIQAIRPTIVTCLAVGAVSGLTSAFWLVRWERRGRLLLVRGTQPVHRPAGRRRGLLGLLGSEKVVALPATPAGDQGRWRTA